MRRAAPPTCRSTSSRSSPGHGGWTTEADALHDSGVKAAADSNSYVRTTVFLATVLFLVGISTQFPLRGARYGLIGVAAVLLVFSLVLLAQLPRPPS